MVVFKESASNRKITMGYLGGMKGVDPANGTIIAKNALRISFKYLFGNQIGRRNSQLVFQKNFLPFLNVSTKKSIFFLNASVSITKSPNVFAKLQAH